MEAFQNISMEAKEKVQVSATPGLPLGLGISLVLALMLSDGNGLGLLDAEESKGEPYMSIQKLKTLRFSSYHVNLPNIKPLELYILEPNRDRGGVFII